MANQAHAEWLKEGVVSWNKRRKKIKFSPDLSGLRFFDLLPADFRDSPKTSRYFEKIDLSSSDLSSSDLSDLNFARANFSESNLTNADLSLSNFSRASFKNADLTNANVTRSLFRFAQFESTSFQGLVLFETDFEHAIFVNSYLSAHQRSHAILTSSTFYESISSYLDSKIKRISSLDPDENLAPSELPEDQHSHKTRKNLYDIFFVTNRNAIHERGRLVDFGPDLTNTTSYGVSEVKIPDSHRIGSLGSPLWKRLLNREDDRLEIKSIISLDDDLFWKHIRHTAESMKIKQYPTIFIHGFNTTFKQAILRTAQIGYDLGIGQGVGLFSWPSKGGIGNYLADEAAVEASKYLLANFIADFAVKSSQGRLNLIAHSMGCRCLIGACEVLANGRTQILRKINQIILAAADVDTALMVNQGLPASKHSTRMTSYASEHDKALKFSGWLHDYPRVGITPPTFVLNGVDTIVVNDSKLGDFSHGYIASSRDILNDVYTLLKRNTPPHERFSLEAITEGSASFWRIKN